jgi:hypothetical protein
MGLQIAYLRGAVNRRVFRPKHSEPDALTLACLGSDPVKGLTRCANPRYASTDSSIGRRRAGLTPSASTFRAACPPRVGDIDLARQAALWRLVAHDLEGEQAALIDQRPQELRCPCSRARSSGRSRRRRAPAREQRPLLCWGRSAVMVNQKTDGKQRRKAQWRGWSAGSSVVRLRPGCLPTLTAFRTR